MIVKESGKDLLIHLLTSMMEEEEQKVLLKDSIDLTYLAQPNKLQACSFCDANSRKCLKITLHETQLSAELYEELIKTGWSRNGRMIVKNNLPESCCKKWDIKLDVTKFIPSKKQIKIAKKWVQIFSSQSQVDQLLNSLRPDEIFKEGSIEKVQDKIDQKNEDIEVLSHHHVQQDSGKKNSKTTYEMSPAEWKESESLLKIIHESFLHIKKCLDHFFQHGFEVEEGILSKIRFFRKNERESIFCNYGMVLLGKNKKCLKKQNKVIDFMKELQKIMKEKFEQKYCVSLELSGYLIFDSPKSKKTEQKKVKEQFAKQMSEERPIKKQQNYKNQKHQMMQEQANIIFEENTIKIGFLEVQIVAAAFREEDYNLYQEFQRQVHGKTYEYSSSYVNFLCREFVAQEVRDIKASEMNHNEVEKKYSPLWSKETQNLCGKVNKKNGSYHFRFLLKGKLIGVGVVDMMESQMNSKYFLYQPSLKKQSFAVFSALLDIEYMRRVNMDFPEFRYYSLGEYCQKNPKLSYKSSYKPFEIQCPVTLNYVECTKGIRDKIDKIDSYEDTNLQLSDDPLIEQLQFQDPFPFFVNHQFQNEEMFTIIKDIYCDFFDAVKLYLQSLGKKVMEKSFFVFPDGLKQTYCNFL